MSDDDVLRGMIDDDVLRGIVDDVFDDQRPRLPSSVGHRFSHFRPLGRGGSATVWRALDTVLDREVALKVFDVGNPSATDVVGEARMVSRVASDYVVRVFESIAGPPHVLVLELVEGYDQAARQRRTGATAADCRPGTVRKAIEWVVSVARGVQDAHFAEVCHLDLKPSNVLIVPGSLRAKVADFGLGVLGGGRRGTADESYVTETGEGPRRLRIAGTPAYMAPEQAAGLPIGLSMRADGDRERLVAIDVFGLGGLAFDLVTGRAPYDAPDATRTSGIMDLLRICECARKSERPSLTSLRDVRGRRISSGLRAIIERAMAHEPRNRYASAGALADDLQAWLDHKPTSLDGTAGKIWLAGRRNPGVVAFAVSALVFGLVVGAEALAYRGLRDKTEVAVAGLNEAQEREQQAQAAARKADEQRAAAEQRAKTAEETRASSERAAASARIDAAKARIDAADARRDDQAAHDKLRKTETQLRAEQTQSNAKGEELVKEQGTRKMLEGTVADRDRALDDLKSTYGETSQQLKEEQAKNSALEKNAVDMKAKFDALAKDYAEQIKERAQAESEAEDLRSALDRERAQRKTAEDALAAERVKPKAMDPPIEPPKPKPEDADHVASGQN